MKDRRFKTEVIPPINGGRIAHMSIIECSCGASDRLHSAGTRNLPPEVISKKFKERGWTVGHNPNRDRCPTCAIARKQAPAPTVDDLAPIIPEPAPAPIEAPAPALPIEEATMTEPTVVPIRPTVLDLTPAQKSRVRDALDIYYDERRGCYTDGKTDAIIGHELNVPWACVTQMRDAAYGPLLIDPEQELLQQSLDQVLKRLSDADTRYLEALDMLDQAKKDVTSIQGRIDALTQRRKQRA